MGCGLYLTARVRCKHGLRRARLGYAGIATGPDQVPVATNTDLEQAVTAFVNTNPGKRKHVYCTYTAMLKTEQYWAASPEVRGAGVQASNHPPRFGATYRQRE